MSDKHLISFIFIMAVLIYASLVFSFVVFFHLLTRRKRPQKFILPPGPPRLPLLGNAHQLVSKAPLKFSEWAKQYGKLYTVYLSRNMPALVVSDIKLMKQIFGTMASTGRLTNPILELSFEGPYGIFNTDGRTWLEQRNFLVNTLKDFGFGSKVSSHLETMMLHEIKMLSNRIEKEMETNGTVYLHEFMKESTGATIWALVTGNRMTSEIAQDVQKMIQIVQKAARSGLLYFPWLKYIAPKWSGYTEAKHIYRKSNLLVEACFAEHEQDGKIDSQKDIISAYLKHTEDMQGNPNSVFYGATGKMHNYKTILTLLIAGVKTTATSLNWLIFYLCVHPEAQRKFQKEIDDVLEKGRDPNLSDKEKMAYVEAVILETLRLSSAVPCGMPHQLTDEINFQGQTLPKGLVLIANTFHVHHDVNIGGDPQNFRPERFLEEVVDDAGNKITKVIGQLRDSVIIFQPGRRTCVGEPVARDVLFMFSAKLFQTFNFLPENDRTKEEYMERQFGLLILPKTLGIRVERRNENWEP